jgi:hypothetical protein
MHTPAGAGDLRFDAPEVVAIDVDEHHRRAFARERFCYRLPYAGAGGGYDRNRIGQLPCG